MSLCCIFTILIVYKSTAKRVADEVATVEITKDSVKNASGKAQDSTSSAAADCGVNADISAGTGSTHEGGNPVTHSDVDDGSSALSSRLGSKQILMNLL